MTVSSAPSAALDPARSPPRASCPRASATRARSSQGGDTLGPEPDAPSPIASSCLDGDAGTYRVDEPQSPFVLEPGTVQAVRAVYRDASAPQEACSVGPFVDHDDLAFELAP
ncbi:hypothetical protein [Anaeromyxobacter sp. SG64]|uniref:hypothetical protein n=1 Tax=Anaeromyxobacter sp. SG64 TaxID=2925409 RepID=UPI001F5A93D1|nr:hypothetical protein [Anaeromyxobacter sp. SG64]